MGSFDALLIVGFLILTLIVGLSHGQKVKTIKDYALGGRNFSTGYLVSTTVATWIGGGFFFIVLSKTYFDGLYFLFSAFGMAISFLITAFIFIPKMGSFLGKTSIAEAMGDLYGKHIRIITAIAGIIGDIGGVAIQFKALGDIFSYFLEIQSDIAIIATALVVIVYSAFGGIRAVTYTDVLQLATFCIAIPLISVIIWDKLHLQGFNIVNISIDPKFYYREVFNFRNYSFLETIPLMLYFAIPSLKPALCQRIVIGSSIQQVKKAFVISAGLLTFMLLAMGWISFLIFYMNPNLKSSQLLGFILDNYTYLGLKELILISVIAMAMSTADSVMHVSSTLFVNDICTPLKIAVRKELILSKIFTILLGVIAIILAMLTQDFLSILLVASSFYMPVVTAPLIFSILGFRSSSKSILIGMSAGFTAIILWKIANIKMNGIVIATTINAIFLLGSHYLLKQPGGWLEINNKKYLHNLKIEVVQKKEKFSKIIQKFNFINFIKNHSPSNEFEYMRLGIYIVIYAFTTMYSIQVELNENSKTMLAIYQTIMVCGIIFSMYPMWSYSIKNMIFMQIVWPIIIFIILIFYSSFFVMLSSFSSLQFAVFSTNTILVIILMGWKLAIPMIVLGFYLSIHFFKYYTGAEYINFSIGSPLSILMYTLILIGTTLIIFFKPKQEEYEATEKRARDSEKEAEYTKRELQNILQGFDFLENQLKQKEGRLAEKEKYLRDQLKHRNREIHKLTDIKDEFLRNIEHEFNTPLTGVLSLCDVVYSCYDDLNETMIKSSMKDIVNSGDRLKTYINSIIDVSKLSATKCELNKEYINLSKLAKDRPTLYKKIFPDETEKQKFIFDVEDNIIVNCDEYYITQAMDNLISNAVSYGRGNPITISLKKTQENKVRFDITDQGIGIPNTELVSIFAKFKVSSKTWTPAGGRGVGLALCQSAIEAHGGTISAESKEDKGSTFTFVLSL